MIDRYVSEALHSTGTRTPAVAPVPTPVPVPVPRQRTARGSSAPAVIADGPTSDFDEETTGVYERSPIYATIFEL